MDQQLSLTSEWVDLSPEELVERGHRLALLVREHYVMDDDHATRRKAMKEEREDLEARIGALAEVVRIGREERPRGVSR